MSERIQKMQCLVCHAGYAFENKGGEAFGCPRCEQAKMGFLRDELREVRAQRDALLKAFEIKATVVPR